MELTQRVRLLASLLGVSAVVPTLAYTILASNRLAQATIRRDLKQALETWQRIETDRGARLKLGVRVLANDPPFKAALGTDHAAVYDMLMERGQDLQANFLLATDPAGIVIARSDRPTDHGGPCRDPVVMLAMVQGESWGVWRQGDEVYYAVAIAMRWGADATLGVLAAGYKVDTAFVDYVARLTRCRVACLVRGPGGGARLSASSEGLKEAALVAALGRPELARDASDDILEVDLGGERYIAVQAPLRSASGESVGSLLMLRSLAEKRAPFARFNNRVVLVSMTVLVLVLILASLAAGRIVPSGS